jgi:hypothetical protein
MISFIIPLVTWVTFLDTYYPLGNATITYIPYDAYHHPSFVPLLSKKNEPIGWEPIMFSKKALKVEVSK